MVIDFHMHIFPGQVAVKAVPVIAATGDITPVTDGTAEDTKSKMRLWGIDRGVFLNIATKPKQTPVINDWAMTFVNDGMLIPFGTVHPEYGDKLGQLSLLYKGGVKGIKIHPDYQDVYADDDCLDEVYDFAESAGMLVLFHAGVDLGYPNLTRGTPERIGTVAKRFPRLKIVAAHYGGYKMWDRAADAYAGVPNIWLDTSFAAGKIPEGIPEKLINAFGAERFLFASDCPWECPAESLKALMALKISGAEKERIAGLNAAELLRIEN